ncbi:MAG TPA: DMT family transporter [Ureibacillus sp.]|uniref:DMT family transporter n=1 Tax=Peribacillus asahii TaxID=228899 RepID=UPI002079F3CD|nr:DMT family transporter [Peribacillus asahii]USK58045.1 DMT family transporter [Peribacillus asahii]HWL24824.1 DMT family transporter [Ureibacillus sp.]
MNKINNLGATAALLSGIIYGVNSIIVKIAHNEGVTTFDLLLYQFFFAFLWFGGRYLVIQKKLDNSRVHRKLIIKNPYNWIAAVTTVLTGLLYYSSIQLTDPSIASLGLFQYPWMLFLMGIIINKETIIFKNVFSVILIWTGTILLIGSTIESMTIAGLIYGVAAGASFAMYLFSLQKITEHPVTKVFIITLATILVAVFVMFKMNQLTIFTKDAFSYGLITAILGQILTFELTAYSAKRVSSVVMGTLTTTELPVAMILTWVIWGPIPTIIKIVGLLLMLFSILWLQYEQSKGEATRNYQSLES